MRSRAGEVLIGIATPVAEGYELRCYRPAVPLQAGRCYYIPVSDLALVYGGLYGRDGTFIRELGEEELSPGGTIKAPGRTWSPMPAVIGDTSQYWCWLS